MKKIIVMLLVSVMLTGCSTNKNSNTNHTTEQTSLSVNDPTETDEGNPLVTYTLDQSGPISTQNYAISADGLYEYDQLSSDLYTDQPAEGKKYLVLFMTISNPGENTYYFNPANLETIVDGDKVENVSLVNDPEEYSTAFCNVEPGIEYKGYIAWEVPEDWQSLEMTYNGWENTDNSIVTAKFTKNDLFEIKDETINWVEE